jgi:GT2 family glycosyltransferase
MKNVLVSFPNNGWLHKLIFSTGMKLASDSRYKSTIIIPTHSPYENNLHHIVNDFIGGNYDYWLNIDADNPPMNNPLDLIELDKDIVGCPTPVYHFTDKVKGERPWYENAYKYVPEEDAYAEYKEKQGLQKVDAVGTGCILIARRVFDHPEMRKGAFTRKLYPDGTVYKGNDISFCERAKEAGFEIFTHYDYRCQHFNEIEMHEVIRAFHGVYTQGK